MTEKEWKIIDEEFISYTGGTAQLISNGECKVHLWETPKDAQLFCDKLNEQHETITSQKEEIQILEEEIEKERNAYWRCNKSRTELFRYKQRVQETLQEAYNQNSRHNTPITTGVCVMLINICKELGVEL